MGTGQISMPGNTAQMGYDYLGQMTSRKVMLNPQAFPGKDAQNSFCS